jgi:hypothetical protein
MNLSSSFQPLKGLTYSWGSNRDLIDEHFNNPVVREARPPDTFLGINVGREVSQSHTIGFNYTPPYLGRTIRPRFVWASGSSKNSSPSLTIEDYSDAVFDITNNNSANLSITVPLGRWTESIFGAPERLPPRPAGGRTAADTTQAGGRDSGGTGDDFRTLFTRLLRFRNIQASGTLSRRSAHSRINGSPPVEYILGLTRDIGLGTDVFTVEGAPFNRSIGNTVSFRGSGGITVLRQIGLDFNYSKRRDKARTNNLLGNVKDNTTWPEINFDWGSIQKRLPLLNKLFTDFRIVNTAFSRSTTTTGTEEQPKETITVGTAWQPLLSISGTLAGWRTSLNANRSSSETTSQRIGSASTTSQRSTVGYQLSLAKKFVRAVGGQGRDIDFKMGLTYTKNSSSNQSSFSTRIQEDKRDQLRLNTSVGIRLTRAMSGTFGFEIGQERRLTTNWTRRTVRLFFSTGFSF